MDKYAELLAIIGACIAAIIFTMKKMISVMEVKDKKIIEIFEKQDNRHEEDRKRHHDLINEFFATMQIGQVNLQNGQKQIVDTLIKVSESLDNICQYEQTKRK